MSDDGTTVVKQQEQRFHGAFTTISSMGTRRMQAPLSSLMSSAGADSSSVSPVEEPERGDDGPDASNDSSIYLAVSMKGNPANGYACHVRLMKAFNTDHRYRKPIGVAYFDADTDILHAGQFTDVERCLLQSGLRMFFVLLVRILAASSNIVSQLKPAYLLEPYSRPRALEMTTSNY